MYTQFGLSVSFMMLFYVDTHRIDMTASYMLTDCDSIISLLNVTHIHKLHWFSVQFLLLRPSSLDPLLTPMTADTVSSQ